jgi:hypothetical protein
MRQVATVCGALGLLMLASMMAVAQQPAAPTAAPVAMTLAQHVERRVRLLALVQACMADRSRCQPAAVGPDEAIRLDDGMQTEVHYDWLRAALKTLGEPETKGAESHVAPNDQAKKTGAQQPNTSPGAASPPISPGSPSRPALRPSEPMRKPASQPVTGKFDRAQLAAELAARLSRSETSASHDPVRTRTARAYANSILAAKEFGAATSPSWIERQWSRVLDWLGRKLQAMTIEGAASRWVRALAEVALFATPVLLLALWLLRQVREDRMRLSGSPAQENGTGRGSAGAIDWASLAREHAQRGDWREAIHALYWETIARFESRRIWSASRMRTPRETLRLLPRGTPRESLLREQTLLLESTWYGYREATATDYDRAAQLRDALENA